MFSLAVAIVSWGLAPVFIRFMRSAYDPYSQAFIRYVFSAGALAAVCLATRRAEFLALVRRPGPILGMACLNTFQQTVWTLGCYGASATLAQLTAQLSVVFVIVFSFFVFHEERRVIRSPVYLVGTALSFGGVAAVLTGGGNSTGPILTWSSVWLLMTALCWGIYVVWAKHLVMRCHPIPMFAALSVFTALGAAAESVVFGSPRCILHAGAGITVVAFVSGLLPLAAAHPAYHFAQKHLGSAFSSSCNLFTPVLTYGFALLILDDAPLTWTQWLGAGVLLSGALMVVWAGRRASSSPGPGEAASPF